MEPLARYQLETLETVAHALGEMGEEVVFVGGMVAALYADIHPVDELRPTKDVDLFLEIGTYRKLEEVHSHLTSKGFTQHAEDQVMCRFRLGEIIVDVMAAVSIGWAPGNRWFESGIKSAMIVKPGKKQVRILSSPYYLATKFSAFEDRGTDPRWSTDFEDIVYVMAHCSYFRDDFMKSEKEVQKYLSDWAQKIINNGLFLEAIRGHLSYATQEKKAAHIVSLLEEMAWK